MTVHTRSVTRALTAATPPYAPPSTRERLSVITMNLNGIAGKGPFLAPLLTEAPRLQHCPPVTVTLLQELKTPHARFADDLSLRPLRQLTQITHVVWSAGSSPHTAGVAILLHHIPPTQVRHSWNDQIDHDPSIGPGHLARLDVSIHEVHYTFISVYMPGATPRPNHQATFLTHTLPACLASHPVGLLVVGGDWNFVSHPLRDCRAATRHHHQAAHFRL